MKSTKYISFLFVLLMLTWCSALVAQDGTDEDVSGPTADSASDSASDSAGETADDGATGNAVDSDVDIFEGMTTEEIKAFISKLKAERLKIERQQVATELKEDLLYDEEEVAAAVKAMEENCKGTLKDNIDLVCKAFAAVDPRFNNVCTLYNEGKFAEASDAAKKIADPNRTNYFSAAAHWMYAKSLGKEGKGYEAVEAYALIMFLMPEWISFAACAAVSAGETFEEMGRFQSAMQWYAAAINNYYLALDEDDVEKIAKKLEEYQDIYKDPIAAVATRMNDVHERLKNIDSGKETQEKEKQIVAILEDLIKSIEENQPGGQGQSESQKKDKRKGSGEGKEPGQDQGNGGNTGKPGEGARNSTLRPGETVRPKDLSKVHDTSDGDDWANLPPRERERLRNLERNAVSDRHKDMVEAYHKRIAEEATR